MEKALKQDEIDALFRAADLRKLWSRQMLPVW